MNHLKRGLSFLLCMGLLFSSALAIGSEVQQETEKIVYDDGSYLTIVTTIYPSSFRSSTQYGKKTYSYTDTSGDKAFTYTLEGWFTYNGSTSTATDVNALMDIYKSGWSLQSHNEYCSGNSVFGTATFTGPSTRTVGGSITCDKNGNIR